MKRSFLILLSCLLVSSCFDNDMMYPDIKCNITSFDIVGQVSSTIDAKNMTVTVLMPRGTSLESLTVKDFTYTEGASYEASYTSYSSSVDASTGATIPMETFTLEEGSTLDLSRTMYVDLHLYQNYNWTITASVENVADLAVTAADVRCNHISIQGRVYSSGTPSVLYKKASDNQWATASSRTGVVEGSGFSVVASTIKGLTAGTDYQVKIVNGENEGPVSSFTTDTPSQIYNMSFDDWYKNDRTWYPYLEDADASHKVWDSANKGTSILGINTTEPEESIVAVSGTGKKAAKLHSGKAVVAFAAGNMFTGQFVKLVGIGAELAWGVPFSSKPVSLHGYYNYKPVAIDNADSDHQNLLGTTDVGQIQVMLTDWDSQFHVISSQNQFLNTDTDSGIIAYGKILIDKATDGYVEFTLPLDYRNFTRVPKWAVLVFASSNYGDYFTGGEGSALYLDEFSFVYD